MTDTRPKYKSSCNHTSSQILLCESLAICYLEEEDALLATTFDSAIMRKRPPASRSMKMNLGRRTDVLKSIILLAVATFLPRVMSDVASSKMGVQTPQLFQGNIFKNVNDGSVYHRRLQSPSGTPLSVTESPSSTPTLAKTDKPSKSPTPGPTPNPSRQPSRHPTSIPTATPSRVPTRKPTDKPSLHPSRNPTSIPTADPSSKPTVSPSKRPTGEPSSRPSRNPTSKPTTLPSRNPSNHPTFEPTSKPTLKPSNLPTGMPSNLPSVSPSLEPSTLPTHVPTRRSSTVPSRVPTLSPSTRPSLKPSSAPSLGPTFVPTTNPTVLPTSLPSKEPSFGPSFFPSKYPSEVPTIFPSLYPSAFPSIKASSSPSSRPTKSPTSVPSTMPSVVPSTTPSVVPSLNPTGLPTLEPSAHPSSRPTLTPTTKPSSNPTFNPSSYPSGHPSSRPSSNPSSRPTQVPSRLPSSTPTQFPTVVPSASPSKSSKPSSQPSTTPSVFPSLNPSQGPSYSRQELDFFILFQFDDLDDVNDKSRSILEGETSRVIKNALERVHTEDTFNVITTLKAKSQISGLSSGISSDFSRKLSVVRAIPRRRLQTTRSGLEVTLQVFVTTRSPRSYDTETLQESIGTAFDTVDKRTAFIDSLQQQDVAFNRINSVQVSIDDKEVKIIRSSSNPWLYVGVGTGVAVAAISSFLFIIYRRRRRNRNALVDQVRPDGRDVRAPNEFIHVDDGEDQDVSTLGYPDAYGGNAFANPFSEDDQQNESMISAAYDYKMAYGGAGGDLPSVSSAGGTKSAAGTRALADDLTEGGQSRQRVDSEDISRISSAQEDLSLFEEDNSFDRMYGEDERIEVIAPPGKLGVVIDTPMNGAPMVHAIKETSVLADRVRIGDRLISVDGQDTTEMSAIRVSKLISSKAMNAQRRMVFLRPASRN